MYCMRQEQVSSSTVVRLSSTMIRMCHKNCIIFQCKFCTDFEVCRKFVQTGEFFF